MSEKMTCPACGNRGSDVLRAYTYDEPCPHCGLSASAASEILGIRSQRASEQVEKQAVEAVTRADRAEAEVKRLERIVEKVRWALSEDEDPPFFG